MRSLHWFLALLAFFTVQHLELADGIPVTAILSVGVPLLLAAAKRMRLDRRALILFSCVVITSLASGNVNGGNVSFGSLAYLLVLTFPFVFVPVRNHPDLVSGRLNFLGGFNAFMIVCVLLGGLQVIAFDEFYSIRSVLPEQYLLEGFNTSNKWDVAGEFVSRSNGFFFLEPSFFSQFLALALLLELRARRRFGIIVVLSVGMLLSLSGTGFILLAAGTVAMAFRTSSLKRVSAMLAAPALLASAVIFWLPSLAARIDELNNEDMSGYWRFVMPFIYNFQSYSESLTAALLGVGPGVAKNNWDTMLMAYSSGFGKIFYENGVLGALPLILLYLRFCRVSVDEFWFSLSMLVFVLVINSGIQQPVVLLTMTILGCYAAPTAKAGLFERTTRRTDTRRWPERLLHRNSPIKI